MPGVQTCEWEQTRDAACATDFGLGLAGRWFGMDEGAVVAAAGRFVRGRNGGKPRGWVVWRKVGVGGWSFGLHGVMRPGTTFARFCRTYDEMQEARGQSPAAFAGGAKRVDSKLSPAQSPVAPQLLPPVTPAMPSDRDAFYDQVVSAFECPEGDAVPVSARHRFAKDAVAWHFDGQSAPVPPVHIAPLYKAMSGWAVGA